MLVEIVRYGVVAAIGTLILFMLRTMFVSYKEKVLIFQDILDLPKGVIFRVRYKIENADKYIVERVGINPLCRRRYLVMPTHLSTGQFVSLAMKVDQVFEIVSETTGRKVVMINDEPKTAAEHDPFGVSEEKPTVDRDLFGDTINLTERESFLQKDY